MSEAALKRHQVDHRRSYLPANKKMACETCGKMVKGGHMKVRGLLRIHAWGSQYLGMDYLYKGLLNFQLCKRIEAISSTCTINVHLYEHLWYSIVTCIPHDIRL